MSSRPRGGDEVVVRRFATACGAGSVGALRSLLTPDAVAISDGGGKVTAALRPVRGADAVARCLTELGVESGTAFTVEAVNGQAGVVLRRSGEVFAVMSMRVTGAKVAAVWIVLNPDKLRHWL